MIWPFNKKIANPGLQLAFQPAGDQLLMLSLTSSGEVVSESIGMIDGQLDEQQLKAMIDQHGLKGGQARVLTGLADYQMLLVEAPPVQQAELAEALKWKVKDLLAQPVEQSIVDGFLLPEDAFRGRQKMAYAVATKRETMQSMASSLEGAGLHIQSISIAEIALLPLLEGQDEHPALVLILGNQGGFIAMIAEQRIYLVRQLDIVQSSLDTGGDTSAEFEKLVLEIQRSRDYFESQMGKGVINRVLALPAFIEKSPVADALGKQLGLPLESLPVPDDSHSANGDVDGFETERLLMSALLKAA